MTQSGKISGINQEYLKLLAKSFGGFWHPIA
jgi:hypothetical protein